MTTLVGAAEAARILDVQRATLYAYVSRGLIAREAAADGRRSLYRREDIERLAAERQRADLPRTRATIDVAITSRVTEIGDEAVRYRGHDAVDLAASCSFEQTAELLLTGDLPTTQPVWPVGRDNLARARSVIAAAGDTAPIQALALVATALAKAGAGVGVGEEDAAAAARRLLAIAPSVFGGPIRGDLATRLARTWRRQPEPALVSAISTALVLLADHELATSTLAVRVACSVRTDPMMALASGLTVMSGPLHGAAPMAVAQFFTEAGRTDATIAVQTALRGGGRLPGFGHTIYKRGDPRFAPLLAAVRSIDSERHITIDAVLAEAGRRVGAHPNVDFALGALLYVGRLPFDAPLFAIARIAGWAAHCAEELSERPLRYRGLATTNS